MPPFADAQSFFGAGVLAGLVIVAALAVLAADWRLALIGLGVQYVLLALVLSTQMPLSLAAVRAFAGGLAAFILYISMRYRTVQDRLLFIQTSEIAPESVSTPLRPQVFSAGCAFRFFAVTLAAVTILGVVSSMSFLAVPTYVLFCALWLMAVGLLAAMLSRDALRLGLGILLFSGGFSVLESAIEGSLLIYGLLSLGDLMIALVVAHLATLPRDANLNQRRGDMP